MLVEQEEREDLTPLLLKQLSKNPQLAALAQLERSEDCIMPPKALKKSLMASLIKSCLEEELCIINQNFSAIGLRAKAKLKDFGQ